MFSRRLRRQILTRTRDKVLYALKERGPSDSQTLATRLGISAMAVRQHLYALRRDRLVTYQKAPRPYGRPAKLWSITQAANRRFPDMHADLTLALIDAMPRIFGKRGLERVLLALFSHELSAIRSRIPKKGSLEQKLRSLARIRDEAGYMAEARHAQNNSYSLVENHCPILAAASACAEICRQEFALFEKILGTQVLIERMEHILAGDRRCLYLIRPRASSSAKSAARTR